MATIDWTAEVLDQTETHWQERDRHTGSDLAFYAWAIQDLNL